MMINPPVQLTGFPETLLKSITWREKKNKPSSLLPSMAPKQGGKKKKEEKKEGGKKEGKKRKRKKKGGEKRKEKKQQPSNNPSLRGRSDTEV